MDSKLRATELLRKRWGTICDECLSVLGSELHYQAMVYHCLRLEPEIPATQIGMNVKMWITDPVSDLFRRLDQKKHEPYRGGFEPIPDIVLFAPDVNGDWRRRNRKITLQKMLLAIEVKASERSKSRLGLSEIKRDIEKIHAHAEEARYRDGDFYPVMMIIDSAPEHAERMTQRSLDASYEFARSSDVGFMYVSHEKNICHLSCGVA